MPIRDENKIMRIVFLKLFVTKSKSPLLNTADAITLIDPIGFYRI